MHFVSTNLKHLRKKHKLSQCDLADRIGLKRGNIASYEKSIAEPKISNIVKLATFFQVSLTDFIGKDMSDESEYVSVEIPQERILVDDELSKIKAQCAQFEGMINGMHCYHSYTMKKIENPSDDIKALSSEVERLLGIAGALMESHKYLIQVIDNHDTCE